MNFLDLNIAHPEVDEAALAIMAAADKAGANESEAMNIGLRAFAGRDDAAGPVQHKSKAFQH